MDSKTWNLFDTNSSKIDIKRALNWISFSKRPHTGLSFKNLVWGELEKSCSLYNFLCYNGVILTGFFYSREKVMATNLYTMIATDSQAIFRKGKWFIAFATHCGCVVFIGMLLGTHLLFKDSQLKKMDAHHFAWFPATVVDWSKLSIGSKCLLKCLSKNSFA